MEKTNFDRTGQFLDVLSDVVLLADKNGKIVKLNKVAEQYFSCENGDGVGVSLNEFFINKRYPKFFIELIDEVIHSRKEIFRSYDNTLNATPYFTNWYIIKTHGSSDVQLIGTKKFPEQNKNLRELFDCLVESMPGNYWWKNTEGIYLGSNSNLEQNLGLDPEQLIGKTDFELPWAEQADELVKHDNEVMRIGKPQKREETVIGPDGKQRTFLVVKSPLKNNEGETIGTVGSSFDITDRKRMEEDLKIAKEQAEAANLVKTEFLENMRHDIRTPLTGIVGFAQIIKEESSDLKIKEYADNLVASGQALLEFLNEILEAIRVTTGEIPILKKKFSLKEKIDDIIKLTKSKSMLKDINLVMEYDEKIPQYFVGDPKRIHRIILELVVNALNFTNNGSVVISASLAKLTDRNTIVRVKVKDTGIGISPDKQQEIFTRFKRLSPSYEGIYKGAGLGLAVVKQFIDDIDAEIYVESELGKGSTFTCLFSLKEALLDDEFGVDKTTVHENTEIIQTQKKSANIATHDKQSGKSYILVVEDQYLAAQVARGILESLDCDVDIAENGAMGLKKVELNHYDLIFMDVGLPDMDGCRVAKEIRLKEWASEKHIPILALTAHIDSENKQRCIAAGMDAVLSKPLTKEKAADLLNAFIPHREKQLLENKANNNTHENLLILSEKVLDLELGAQLLGGKKEIALEMVAMLVGSFPEELANFELAHTEKDWNKIKDLAHKMKGGACYCGTPRLKDACTHLEDYLRKNETELVEKLYEQLITEIKAVQSAYEAMKKSA